MKKVFATALICTMLFSLAACNSSKPQQTVPESTETTTEVTETTQDTEATETTTAETTETTAEATTASETSETAVHPSLYTSGRPVHLLWIGMGDRRREALRRQRAAAGG